MPATLLKTFALEQQLKTQLDNSSNIINSLALRTLTRVLLLHLISLDLACQNIYGAKLLTYCTLQRMVAI